MNSTYFLFLGIGAILCTGLFAWKLQRAGQKTSIALLSLPLALVLGTVLSKLVHFLLLFRDQYGAFGLEGLFRTNPTEFSFLGGCAGAVLAVWLAARCHRTAALPVMDAFAPCGALMAALARACEYFLDIRYLLGYGAFVENESLHFFPIARENEMLYSWFYAIFMLEAACALICALVSFGRSHKKAYAPGRVFLHTVFFLALPQVFCERLLGSYMRWGFVRVEQLLCGFLCFGIILYGCTRLKQKGAYTPALLAALCMLMIIDIEFTLDNKPPFGLEMPTLLCYILMLFTLAAMAALSLWTWRRLNRKEALTK